MLLDDWHAPRATWTDLNKARYYKKLMDKTEERIACLLQRGARLEQIQEEEIFLANYRKELHRVQETINF